MKLLKVGRSKQSQLVLATRNVHVFIWTPKMNNNSFGFTVRVRHDRDWRHWRLILMQRNALDWARVRKKGKGREGRFLLRPTLTLFEASSWWTENGVRDRLGIKSYLRLKLALGARTGRVLGD